jgi:ATP-dependent DNA ligase
MLASHQGKRTEIISRRGTDYSDRFPEIIAELLTLPDVVLDTELVCSTNGATRRSTD